MLKKRKENPESLKLLLDIIHDQVKQLQENAKEMDFDAINKEYETLQHQLWFVRGQMHNYLTDFIFNNMGYIDEIDDALLDIKEKYMQSNQRKEILEKLEPYFDYNLPKEEKIKVTNWLYNELKLSDGSLLNWSSYFYTPQGVDFRGLLVNNVISSRQIGTMQSSLRGARSGSINIAFHEMIDFIENVHLNYLSPISNFERLGLKIMCEAIFSLETA